jgi:hypothetical protein
MQQEFERHYYWQRHSARGLHWSCLFCIGKGWKAQRVKPGLSHQKAQGVDPPASEGPRVDWRIEYEFNKVFMTTSKNGKEALIKRWTDRKKCDREEAMRLAIEELRRYRA